MLHLEAVRRASNLVSRDCATGTRDAKLVQIRLKVVTYRLNENVLDADEAQRRRYSGDTWELFYQVQSGGVGMTLFCFKRCFLLLHAFVLNLKTSLAGIQHREEERSGEMSRARVECRLNRGN